MSLHGLALVKGVERYHNVRLTLKLDSDGSLRKKELNVKNDQSERMKIPLLSILVSPFIRSQFEAGGLLDPWVLELW